MKNSIYLLSPQNITIEKFHLCTWDVRGSNTFVEIGVSIENKDDINGESIELYVSLPFVSNKCKINSLHETLHDSDNYKFIFNEIPENVNAIDGAKRNGSIVALSKVKDNDNPIHLIANATTEIIADKHLVKILLKKPDKQHNVGHIYARLLVETDSDTIAEIISGIAKRTYVFDIKINELRNIPNDVLDFKRENKLNICNAKAAYCLHCVPDNYEISFSDSSKLKNVRKLEKDAFQKYLPLLKNLKGEYIITFIKDNRDEAHINSGYSFFTSFNKEIVGNKQLLVAIITNLICNLLFAIAAFRVVKNTEVEWFKQLPLEWWIAVCVIVFGILFCLPVGSWIKKLKNAISRN